MKTVNFTPVNYAVILFSAFLFLAGFFPAGLSAAVAAPADNITLKGGPFDTIPEKQLLYVGRWWRNVHYMVKGDQFLFTKDFIPGSVALNGSIFNNIGLRYDIYNDELMTTAPNGAIIQLNKEMVDSFSLGFEGKEYLFGRFPDDSLKGIKGYMNILYQGGCTFMVKYRKEIELLAVDRQYDLFFQVRKIYLFKNGILYNVAGKGDLLKILSDQKIAIRSYIKKNRLMMSKDKPETFVPLIRYYDSLTKQNPQK